MKLEKNPNIQEKKNEKEILFDFLFRFMNIKTWLSYL